MRKGPRSHHGNDANGSYWGEGDGESYSRTGKDQPDKENCYKKRTKEFADRPSPRGWESTQLMWFRDAKSANYRGNLGYCYSFFIIKLS